MSPAEWLAVTVLATVAFTLTWERAGGDQKALVFLVISAVSTVALIALSIAVLV